MIKKKFAPLMFRRWNGSNNRLPVAQRRAGNYCKVNNWRLSLFTSAIFGVFVTASLSVFSQSANMMPFAAAPLTEKEDLSALMVSRIDQFLTTETQRQRADRNQLWHRDFSSAVAFNQSVSAQRQLLSDRLGVVDHRVRPKLELMTNDQLQPFTAATKTCVIQPVRWEVFEGLSAEGLLIRPKGKIIARIVLIPDADGMPEVLAGLRKGGPGYAVGQRLASSGWEVLIPTLVSRADTFSGNPSLGLSTNLTHREWIYRQGYEVGRHVIGYELQKIFSAIDWFTLRNGVEGKTLPIGVAGYGEGGLLALYAASLDTRVSASLVSGYFNQREQLWREPIYHNVFGLLTNFGDAELAVMAWPRVLVVEQSKAPEIEGPPVSSRRRSGAAPGSLATPAYETARDEWARANEMEPKGNENVRWCSNGNADFKAPFSEAGLAALASGLHVKTPENHAVLLPLKQPQAWVDSMKRQERTVRGMEQTVQKVLTLSERTRDAEFWQMLKGDTAAQKPVKAVLRTELWNQLGQLPTPSMPANPRARLLQKTDKWTSYEVMLDVWPGVFAWGILVVPNDIKPGQRRPVVVCQHGLESVPADVITTDSTAKNFHFYRGFASRLADRGYIVFAPCNLYLGGNKFRVLQRKANPLGLTLFSVMIGQHERILQWLKGLSFADPDRIGFYGLSYGGKSAMRIPAVVQGYALSICSGDFNEWIRKCSSTDYRFSYLYTGEYDMQEWDLGHTFSYAEMAALIAPRPFMVERGHYDGVAADEWVGYEFAKVQRHYDLLGLSRAAAMEYFVGPHTINGLGTFEFLDRYLMNKTPAVKQMNK